MKKFLIVLLSGFITLSVSAQTITITLNGTNKNTNYQVVLDGTSFYSNSSIEANNRSTSVKKDFILDDQELGSHTIEVYRFRGNPGTVNSGTNTNTSGNAIYSNTFQLRQGYDMNISINGNGQVAFSEKRVTNNRPGNNNVSPMTYYRFNQLMKTVRSRSTQTSKIAAERDAFLNTSNYFSTDQVRQLLLLVSSEYRRVELAKLAYRRVTDPSNFTQIYSIFNNMASRNEMNAFIRNNPNINAGNNGNGSNNNSSNRTPMSDYQFSQLFKYADSQNNQTDKVISVGNAIDNATGYFSTSQIRQFLSIINAETDRLDVAKQSYPKISNPSSFTSLYDLFYNKASRDELNNLISGNTNNQNTNNTRNPMADYQFSQVVQKVNAQWNQSGKFNVVRDAFNTTGYYSTMQIRQLLLLLNAENDRLALAKLSYARVSDAANFSSLYDVLNSQSSRNDLNSYVIQNGGTGTTVQTTSRIPMSDAVFNQLYQNASNHIRPSSTIDDLRVFFNNSSYYFSTAQIRQLLSLVSSSLLSPLASETDMLEVAKLSWHRVTDPANFTQIFSLFPSQANRDALRVYIEARPY